MGDGPRRGLEVPTDRFGDEFLAVLGLSPRKMEKAEVLVANVARCRQASETWLGRMYSARRSVLLFLLLGPFLMQIGAPSWVLLPTVFCGTVAWFLEGKALLQHAEWRFWTDQAVRELDDVALCRDDRPPPGAA